MIELGTTRVLEDVTCPFCGCLCDDIRVVTEEGGIKEIYNGCALAQSRFSEVKRRDNRNLYPTIGKGKDRKKVSYGQAMEEALHILENADHPLLYGWANTSCEAQKAGVKLAEVLGGSIDDTSSTCHGPGTLGIQETGYVTATLGTVKNRADFIIYWGCNPFHAHPRHISRYTVFPRGSFISGRSRRNILVVDPRCTTTSRIADKHLQPDVGGDYEILNALRVLLKGKKVFASEISGIPTEILEDLVEEMKSAKFGAFFFGLGLTMTRGRNRNVESALKLVQDLNQHTKWVISAMRGHYNVTGFNEVCAWETGYPFSVDFCRGVPRYNPGETSGVDLIRNQEIDAMLVIAADPVAHLPFESASRIQDMPTITIDPFQSITSESSDVVIPTAVAGIEAPGTAYRMDGVPLPLKRVVDPPQGLITDEEVLKELTKKLEVSCRS